MSKLHYIVYDVHCTLCTLYNVHSIYVVFKYISFTNFYLYNVLTNSDLYHHCLVILLCTTAQILVRCYVISDLIA